MATAVIANEEVREIFELPQHSPVIRKTCLLRDRNGSPIIYEEATWGVPQQSTVIWRRSMRRDDAERAVTRAAGKDGPGHRRCQSCEQGTERSGSGWPRLLSLSLAAVAAPVVAQDEMADWDAVLAEAEGQTVNFHMWSGSDAINAYVDDYIGGKAAELGITLQSRTR